MFISPTGNIYIGEMAPGDRPATDVEVAAWEALRVNAVVQSVTPLQARRAMRQTGVLDAVKAAVGTNPEMQDAFDYATSFNRESTFIAQAQALLQWTDAQIDDLFRLAASFTD